jgi:hypothetical protein
MKDIIPFVERITLTGSVAQIDKALDKQTKALAKFRYDGPVGTKGPWTIKKFVVPKDSLAVLRLVRDGGRGTGPGDYHMLTRKEEDGSDTIVMSDTNAEMGDFLNDMREAEGHVLVGGLGMGLAIKAMLLTKKVKSITVVELSQDLIDLVGGHYRDIRVRIVQGDIFKYVPPKNFKYDWAWFDIWDTISDDNLPDMAKLRERYRPVVKGKGRERIKCWVEYECSEMALGNDARHWY